MRLSAPLFCSVMDAPAAKPLTDPPIVKGPVPPPPPPVPPLPPTGPLQAERTKEVRSSDRETTDLKWGFIEIDCSFGTSRLRRCGQLPRVRHSPGRSKLEPGMRRGRG